MVSLAGSIEFFIILVVAILVIRPEDMPQVLRQVGHFVGKMRSFSQDIRWQLDKMSFSVEEDVSNEIIISEQESDQIWDELEARPAYQSSVGQTYRAIDPNHPASSLSIRDHV